MDETLELLTGAIETGRFLKNSEIEVRLGTLYNSHFESGVDYNHFYQMEKQMDQYSKWDKVQNVEFDVEKLYTESNTCRLRVTTDEKKTMVQRKTRVENVDFRGLKLSYDVRLSTSQEEIVDEKTKLNHGTLVTRYKKRTRYWLKDIVIDFTTVKHIKNEITTLAYEIEIEILLHSKLSSMELAQLVLLHSVQLQLITCMKSVPFYVESPTSILSFCLFPAFRHAANKKVHQ